MSRVRYFMICKPANRPPCEKTDRENLWSYTDVVKAYIRDYRPDASRLLQFFKQCKSLEIAIEYAAGCKLPSGQRHPHQYRLSKSVLVEAQRRLRASTSQLQSCETFAELHEIVADRIGGIKGIGSLTVYDISHHLGAYRGLEPEVVYLHAGAALGAKALRLNHHAESLDLRDVPAAFRRLRPHEIEDCLCLYRDEFKVINDTSATK